MSNDMLENWKALCTKKVNEVDPSLAFPMLRWTSGNLKNLEACARIDELFFKVPARVVISLLAVNTLGGFIKYPKAVKKASEEVEELKKKHICKIYHWSALEYEKNRIGLGSLKEQEVVDFINKKVGLDKKECKILGVEYNAKKCEFKDKPKGLSAFM